MPDKLHIIIFCVCVAVILSSCSSSVEDSFDDMIKKHKNVPQRASSKQIEEKRFIDPQYSYDTFFIKVHRTEISYDYYMAAELIQRGNRIYRVLLIWEIDPVLFFLIMDRPYGRSSWNFVAWLTNDKIFRTDFYLRPVKGEEFRKIKSVMFEKNMQKMLRKTKIQRKRR